MKRSTSLLVFSFIVLALVASLILVLYLASSRSSGTQSGSETEEGTKAGEAAGDGAVAEPQGQGSGSQGQAGDQGGAANPGQGDNSTGGNAGSGSQSLVINFPDPANSGGGGTPPEEAPPAKEEPSIYGQWIMEMTGSNYGFKNLHIRLEKDGSITIPADYSRIMEITSSRYVWEAGNPDFKADIRVVLKLGSEYTSIPVVIGISGQVSDSLNEIAGNFTATPEGEVYAPYSQQGNFKMQR